MEQLVRERAQLDDRDAGERAARALGQAGRKVLAERLGGDDDEERPFEARRILDGGLGLILDEAFELRDGRARPAGGDDRSRTGPRDHLLLARVSRALAHRRLLVCGGGYRRERARPASGSAGFQPGSAGFQPARRRLPAFANK